MTAQMDALRAKIKEQAKTKRRGRKKVWHAPTLEDFAHGTVLAFDQTLTKTGWSLVACDEWGLGVLAGGVAQRPPLAGLKGFEETYAKAEQMGRLIEAIVSQCKPISIFDSELPPPDAVVHEMPAVIGHRLESSLMAGREVRRVVAEKLDMPVTMISRQQAYATLVGAPSTEKAHGTARVNLLIPREQRRTTRWNQDVHDSVLLGLQWLYNKKRGER